MNSLSSSSDKLHDEYTLMRAQLDALLLGQGRLETAVASIASHISAPCEAASEIQSPMRILCTEVAHGVADTDIDIVLEEADPVSADEHKVLEGKEQKDDEEASTFSEDEALVNNRPRQSVNAMITTATMQAEANYVRRKKRLKNLIDTNNKVEKEENDRLEAERIRQTQSLPQRAASLSKKDLETYLDSVMGVLIVANTIFIGLSLDHNKGEVLWNAWKGIDVILSLMFFCEFVLKLYLHHHSSGPDRDKSVCCGHFRGPDKISNLFDSVIIMLDMAQLIATVIESVIDAESEDTVRQYVSLLRVARLVRILRVLRILKVKRAQTLVDMLQGLIGGVGTLGWAVVLLALFVYVAAVLARVFFGNESNADITALYPVFENVPRSMLTIFRCGFGDCSNTEGIPLAELIDQHYGRAFALGYCGFTFFITVGFFNIVSAIFVDSTMTASAEQFLRGKQKRLDDYNLWARSATGILKALLRVTGKHANDTGESLASDLESIIHVEFQREDMAKALEDQTVKDALEALDIDPNDHGRLSDILDPDHSGTIGVLELVDGLRRLRGEPRRSDVVALDLMMRSLQEKVEIVLEEVLLLVKAQHEDHAMLQESHAMLQQTSR